MLLAAPLRRAVLLAAALLSACAAAGSPAPHGVPEAPPPQGPGAPGVFGSYLAGRFALAETDTRVAAERLLEVLRRDPDQPEPLARAFVAALLDARPDAARLARRLPENQAAALLLVGTEAQAGRWERAEARIRALPRQGPAQLLQPVLLAWTQQARGNVDGALATLRPLAEGGRLRGLHALHMAMIADVAGRPREAERWTRSALAETPQPSLRVLQIVAGLLARAGREAEALRLLERAARGLGEAALALGTEEARRALIASRPVGSATDGMAEAHVALAAALRGQGAGETPLILTRLALRLRPGCAQSLLLIAEQLAEERHPEAALLPLDEVAPGDPLARVAALRRGLLLDRLDRTAEAVAALRRLAQEAPWAAQPLASLGDLLRARGRHAEATGAYDEAVARLGAPGAGDWPLLYARGIAQERAGNWPRAEADFLAALALSPEQPYVLNYLAYTWVEQGRELARARAMLERAVELRPNDGNIVDSLGWALFRLDDLPGAVRWLERATELEPRNSVINDHLGDAYWAVGRRAEAQFQWRRALGLEPEPQDAARIAAKLRDGLPDPAPQAERPAAGPR